MFWENMRSGGHSDPRVQLAAWNVTEDILNHKYFPTDFFQLITTPILPVGQV